MLRSLALLLALSVPLAADAARPGGGAGASAGRPAAVGKARRAADTATTPGTLAKGRSARRSLPAKGTIEDALLDLFGARDFVYGQAARERAVENNLATVDPTQRAQMVALAKGGTSRGHRFVQQVVSSYTVAEALRVSRVDFRRYASPEGDFSLYVFADRSGTLIDGQGFAMPQTAAQASSLIDAWSRTDGF
jgi:hypothetical protein